jgi:hypothetical protein
MNDATQILGAIDQGGPKAVEQLLPLVYDGLRDLAIHILGRVPPGQTLQPTALVHEAYLLVLQVRQHRRVDEVAIQWVRAEQARRQLVNRQRPERIDEFRPDERRRRRTALSRGTPGDEAARLAGRAPAKPASVSDYTKLKSLRP